MVQACFSLLLFHFLPSRRLELEAGGRQISPGCAGEKERGSRREGEEQAGGGGRRQSRGEREGGTDEEKRGGGSPCNIRIRATMDSVEPKVD